MKIGVLVKQVAGSESPLRIDSNEKWIDESSVDFTTNESDSYALEEALQIIERSGGEGEVVVVSMGPADRTPKVIREALAKGGHRAIHIQEEPQYETDPFAVASIFAEALKDESFDLILSGLQSDDLSSGQTGVILGELLGMSTATLVMGVELLEGKLKVKRELESGWFQWVTLPFPACITIQSGLNQPRYPSLKGIMGAKKKEIKPIAKADLASGLNSMQEISSMYMHKAEKRTEMIEGSADQVVGKLVDIFEKRNQSDIGVVMDILLVLEGANGSIHRISKEALAAAQALGKDLNQKVSILAFGKNADDLAKEASSFQAEDVLLVNDDKLNNYSADGYAEVIKQVVEKESPNYVIMGYSYLVRDFFPKVSARLQKPLITDVVSYKNDGGQVLFTKQVLHGKLTVDIEPKVGGPVLIGFQSAAYSADNLESGTANVRNVEITLDANMLKTTSEEPFQEDTGGVDLTSADKIISIGRGVGKEENMQIIKDLAESLKAEIGASRPIVDSGWLPSSHQVGSSGQSVSPNLYLALGISGAIQHVVGMKGSKNIVAINRDPDAPIFEVADYGIVGDIIEIVPKLTEVIKNQ